MNAAYDVCVVGAGAAGLMTAIEAKKYKLKVLLLDSQAKVGAKILMSGGTRCNVTNDVISERDYNSEQLRIIRNILNAFSSEKTLQFFKHLGVNLVLEPGGKYFPTTHSGKTILEVLLKEVDLLDIETRFGYKVKDVYRESGKFAVCTDEFKVLAKYVVICTGGLSHAATGSDGSGYRFARVFKHNLIETTAALTPFLTNDQDCKELSGVAVDADIKLVVDGNKEISFEGPFLFTHFGFSGPAVLNISRHWVRQPKNKKVEVMVNFVPTKTEAQLREQLNEYILKHPKKTIKSFFLELLPERFVEMFFKRMGMESNQLCNQFKKDEREKCIKKIMSFALNISGVYGYKKAEVTAGGVDLSELDPKTLESTLEPGLFFAGEVVDVDGRIGGFNFQWAWASGSVVANAIAEKLARTKVD